MMMSEDERQILLHSADPAMQAALNIYTGRSAESRQVIQAPAKNTDAKPEGVKREKPISGAAAGEESTRRSMPPEGNFPE